MFRAFKYRIYPTESQKAEFAKIFGCRRYICNYYVREHERAWREEGRTLFEFDLMRLAQDFKQDKPWLCDADSGMMRWAAIGIVKGYRYFFDHINVRPPHERKKGERPYQTYSTYGSGLNISFRQNLVFLPKIGAVRAKIHRRFYGNIKHATVRLTASGRYYVSLCVETREPEVPMRPFDKDNAVGIDVGIRHFLTLSDGSHYEMPDMTRTINRRAFLQRRLKMQKPGSKGYQKTKLQIARLNEHISNSRLNFHHKTAIDICSRYSTVCMETINAEQMRVAVGEKKKAKDNGFNRKLNHVGLGQFSGILETTAQRMGVNFARIDRWEPSTKRCHVCGHVLDKITLDVEEWTCPHCGTHHDRDVNAAINIRDKGIENIQLPPAEGKVKPAKAALTDDERTGKVTGNDVRRPSTQIEEGTAPPRLANKLAHYVTLKSIQPENIWQSIDKLRKTRVMEDSKYGVMEYFSEVGNIIRLSSLCEEFDIRFSRSKYIYTLKGLPEYKKLFDAIQITIPAMLEEVAKEKEDEIRRSVEKHMNKREPSERKYNLSITEGVTGMAYFISSSAVARLAGTSAPLVDNWAMTRTYDNPRPKQFDKIQRIINAYRQIGKMLRELSCNGFTLADARDFNINARKLVQINKVCSLVGLPTSKYLYIYNIFCTSTMNKLMNFLNVTLPNMIDAECLQMQDNLNRAMQGLETAKIEALNSTNLMRKSSDDVLLPNPEWDITTAKKVAYDIAKYEAMKNYFLK